MDRPRRDPTANTAIGNVMWEQRRKRRRDAIMKQDLNPCANCGGVAAIRREAGIAVAACTNCGRAVGPFDMDDSTKAVELAGKAWNVKNPVTP